MFYGRSCWKRKHKYEAMLFILLGVCAALYQVVAVYNMTLSKDLFHGLMSDIRGVPWVDPRPGESVENTVELFFAKLDLVWKYIQNASFMRWSSVRT